MLTRNLTAAVTLVLFGMVGITMAQAKDSKPAQPAAKPAGNEAESPKRAGDPYPLGACPVSEGKLTATKGFAKLYEGREVRFCCGGCTGKFEKDLAANLARLDDKIIKDQAPLYPLKTSLVTGKDLPAKPFQFVYGNRLIQLGAESEKSEFLKDSAKHLAALDKSVVDGQSKDYPLTTCVVSGETLEKDATNMVVAGRLIRLCCSGCKSNIEADPPKFIAMVDEARKGQVKKDDKPSTPKTGR